MDFVVLWLSRLVDAFDRRNDALWAAIPIRTVDQLSRATGAVGGELESRFWRSLAELDGGDA